MVLLCYRLFVLVRNGKDGSDGFWHEAAPFAYNFLGHLSAVNEHTYNL